MLINEVVFKQLALAGEQYVGEVSFLLLSPRCVIVDVNKTHALPRDGTCLKKGSFPCAKGRGMEYLFLMLTDDGGEPLLLGRDPDEEPLILIHKGVYALLA